MSSSKGLNVVGSTQGTRSELECGLYIGWLQGKIRSVIDSIFSLEEAPTRSPKNAFRKRSVWKNTDEAIVMFLKKMVF